MSESKYAKLLVTLSLLMVAGCGYVNAAPLPAAMSPTSIAISTLTVEHEHDPIGLDEPKPRLSWQMTSQKQNQSQLAYQVLVSSSVDRLQQDVGDLWDTGKIISNQSINIRYGGKILPSRQQAVWKVRVWDQNDEISAWSTMGSWEAGLLTLDHWGAKWIGRKPMVAPPPPAFFPQGARWIWYPEGEPRQDPGPARRFFRTQFELPEQINIIKAIFIATADSPWIAAVNGVEVGTGLPAVMAILDVAANLKKGRNTIALYANHGGGPAGALAQLVITPENGPLIVVSTDGQWKTGKDKPLDWSADKVASRVVNAREIGKLEDEFLGIDAGSIRYDVVEAPTYLRRSFNISEEVTRARLYVTAKGLYEMTLNGNLVGDQHFTPGWTDYRKRIQYQTFDVTDSIRVGENVLGGILGDGWFAGKVGWSQQHNHYGPYPLQLLARLVIEMKDGSSRTVVSDDQWLSSTGPLQSSDLIDGEMYDARKEMDGWDEPGFSGVSSWQKVVTEPLNESLRIVAAVGPPVRVTEELKPIDIDEPRTGMYVFDLGQNIVGWARLRTRGPAAARIQLRFAEMLNPDGTIYIENLRGAKATDVYITNGSEIEVWEPKFTFHGFRYVEVTGLSGVPDADTITGIVAHSDTLETGMLETSNELVNKLQHNIVWGQRGNFVDVPTDCPQRDERLGWMGDAQIFARTACFNMDVSGFFRKWLINVGDDQTAEGSFQDYSPNPFPATKTHAAPGWGDAGVIVPWSMYQCYGDISFLEDYFDAMRRWVEYLHQVNPDGLWEHKRGANYGDWIAVNSDTPKDMLATAYYFLSTKLVGRSASVLGRNAEAELYRQRAASIRKAFNDAFVDENGKIKGDTQTAYLLALRFGLLDEQRRGQAVEHLLAALERNNFHLSTGFLGVRELLPALTDAGQTDIAYRILLKETYPSWGYSIRQGATTIWERWDGWTQEKGFQTPSMNSFNHYALGSVGQWLYATVGGIDIDPAQPGYKHVIVRPQPSQDLDHARARYDSHYGLISTEWTVDEGRFDLHVNLPVNVTGTVFLPGEDEGRVVGSGGHEFSKLLE